MVSLADFPSRWFGRLGWMLGMWRLVGMWWFVGMGRFIFIFVRLGLFFHVVLLSLMFFVFQGIWVLAV